MVRVLVTEGDHLDLELRPASFRIACFMPFISGGRPTALKVGRRFTCRSTKVQPVQLRKRENSKGSTSANFRGNKLNTANNL